MDNSGNRPIVLVHGLFRQAGVFGKLTQRLQRSGRSVYAPNLIHRAGAIALEEVAAQVADYIDRTLTSEQSFDLVGLSMGGLVARYYLQRLGGLDRVERLVTISAPHHGTWMAYGLPRTNCWQMRPGSAFVRDLNRDADRLARLEFTSIWTPWDFIIVPPSSSQMPMGRNIQLPIFAHAMMVRHPRSIEAVATALECF
jgi:triacylglycerol lipase